jgi:hypothetical protein
MRLHRSTAAFVAAAMLAIVTIASAAKLDPPTLTVLETSRTSITIQVQAGTTGAPGGFNIQWMKRADYDRLGWVAPGATGSTNVVFYGFPTYNRMDGTNSYQLAPSSTQIAEPGDLFDETGLLLSQALELDPMTDYVFRAWASSDGNTGSGASAYSNTVMGTTTTISNCTFTQGYWKNHPSSWPATSLTLGTVSYTKDQLLQILGQPARGNGLVILAHQLIAAKLNILQGADPSSVIATIAAADALIDGLVCPPIGGGNIDPATVDDLAQTLDSFNNGTLGVPHCGTTPVRNRTWGALKAIYR